MLIKGETLNFFPLMPHHLQVAVAAAFPEFVSLTRELLHLFHGKDEMHFQILDHPQKLDHEELLSAKEKPRPRSRQATIATNFRTKKFGLNFAADKRREQIHAEETHRSRDREL